MSLLNKMGIDYDILENQEKWDDPLDSLSTNKSGTKVPILFRKIIKIKTEGLLTKDSYETLAELYDDNQLLLHIKNKARRLGVLKEVNFIIDKHNK